ncbi:hypothetical protein TNCV_3806051 [Trichonephila clavipes]|nr:hypothetical protein TNCV_3806051 [Trichonephila clavipes]
MEEKIICYLSDPIVGYSLYLSSTAVSIKDYFFITEGRTGRTARKLYARFKTDDFNPEDHGRLSRPSTIDEDQIKTLIENNVNDIKIHHPLAFCESWLIQGRLMTWGNSARP